MIQYEEHGNDVTQIYYIFVLQAKPAKSMNSLWLAKTWPKKVLFGKKNRIWDRFVKILLSCDASRIIENISGDIWESMLSYEWKTPVTDGYFPTIPVRAHSKIIKSWSNELNFHF